MMEEDIDLEDLEWRLYSQVYHSSGTNEENSSIYENTNSEVSSVSGNQKKSFRYYEKKIPQVVSTSEAQTYISLGRHGRPGLLEDTSTSKVQNDFTFDTNSTSVVTNCDTNQFHNNITVNQFTVPVILHPERVLSSQPKKYFTSWSAETLKLLTKRNRTRKRKPKPKREDIEKHNTFERKRRTNGITIWLSDDSDDCVIVEKNVHNNKPNKINTGFPKKYNESEGGEKPELDDDIIYIPPPPIEVIDIEANEIEGTSLVTLHDKSSFSEDISNNSNVDISLKNLYKPDENEDSLKSPESVTSNDFLENTPTENVPTNFNFSLHGSDFNNSQGDFVRPSIIKPVEYCETESSCSTNEQSRDFSNTVKTIVFDEVEFPKEDIFSDKNLESFSSFITPKRNSNFSKEISSNQSSKANDETIQNPDTSSDGTSSESDYDSSSKTEDLRLPESDPKYKNLPNLSPMVAADETPRTSIKKKKARNFFQNRSKVELEKKSSIAEDSFNPKVGNTEVMKTQSKRKKKNPRKVIINSEDNDQFLSDDYGEKLAKKNAEPEHFSLITDNEEKTIAPDKQKTKKRKSVSSENLEIMSDTVPEKSKKKKKRSVSTEDDTLPTDVENTNNSESISIKHQLNANVEKIGKTIGNVTSAMIESETCQNNDIEDLEVNVLEESMASDRQKKKLFKPISDNPQNASGDEISKNIPEKLKKRKKKRDSTSEKQLQIEKDEDANAPTKNTTDVENSNDKMKSLEIVQNCSRNERDQMENHESFILNLYTDTEITSDVEVITSSDSEVQISESAGGDITLANCFSPPKSTEKNKHISKNNRNGKILKKTVSVEKFDVDQIHENQSDNPEKWQISYKDRAIYLNMDINRGPRCNRCRHFGHTSLKCSEKPELPSCFLCGQPDHREPRCPNKRCTQCGNPGDFSTFCWKCFKFRNTICRLCKMKGHIENTCPDLWRRYHSTTDDGPIVVSRGQVKPRNQQWCSGCARQGHLEHECSYNREYPPTTPYIMNYEDNLAQNKDRLPQSLIAGQESLEGAPRNLEDSIPNLPRGQRNSLSQPAAVSPLMSNRLPSPNHLLTYDQLINPNQVLVPNQLPVLDQLPALNQIACLSQVLNPAQLQILSQLPVLNQLEKIQNVVRNPVNPNFTNEFPNRVLNPCSISNTARSSSSTVNFDNEYYLSNAKKINLIDEKQIKQIILSMPFSAVNDFLAKEMKELENSNIHPRLLKSKLYRYDKILKDKKPIPTKLQREKCYWFRILNMFIFGMHRFGDGRLHVNYLRKYLADSKSNPLDDHKRRSLLSSYSYIFTYDKHKNVNYYKWINILIQKYEEGKK